MAKKKTQHPRVRNGYIEKESLYYRTRITDADGKAVEFVCRHL